MAALLFAAAASAADDYLDQSLRASVDALQADVQAQPTTPENLAARLDVLWPWANAFVLNGWPIHPELPWTVGQLRAPGARPDPAQLADIDEWVREMAYREARPAHIGVLSTPKRGPFPVDAHSTLIMDYVVGERALEPGDGLLIAARNYAGGTALQTDDPTAPNYLSASTDQPGVRFVATTGDVTGWFSGRMGKAVTSVARGPRPLLRLAEGRLPPGSRVRLTLGDTSGGSPGMYLPAVAIDGLRIRVWVHLGSEDLRMNLAEIPFQSVGGPVTQVRATVPSVLRPGERPRIAIWSGDRFRNRATGPVPAYRVLLDDEVVAKLPAGDEAVSELLLPPVTRPGVVRYHIESLSGELSAVSNPMRVDAGVEQRVYWGETHGHSGFSEGVGGVDAYYRFAREDGRLDFVTLSEHDVWMDDAEWREMAAAVQRHHVPGVFETFLGYEWTVNVDHGGHHNVLFRTPVERERIGIQVAPELPELYAGLSAHYDSNDLLIIPHAHNPGDWTQTDAATERFVEISSNHGNFEWFGQAYLAADRRVGFLGGSDDHYGHPGLRPLRRVSSSDYFGGLAAVYAPALNRDELFDAMRARHGYATTGQRTLVQARLNDALPGSVLSACGPVEVTAEIAGTAPIESLQVVRNERVVYHEKKVQPGDGALVELRLYSDSRPAAAGEFPRSWQIWDGVLIVSGAKILDVSAPRSENIYTEFVRIDPQDPQRVRFFQRTRGAVKNLLLRLGDIDEGAAIGVELAEPETVARETGIDQLRFDAWNELGSDGAETRWQLRRVRWPAARDVSLRFRDPRPAAAGDRYYLRIEQVDGGMAWTSPWFIQGCADGAAAR